MQYAPSVRVGMAERFGLPANEPCTGKLVAALRRLGVDVVYDTNLTADLTIMEESAEFLEKVKTGAKLPMFTSCCPGWIQHVEHRHPHLMPQVSTCGSPMAMFGSLIRKQFAGENVYSVAIMPCTGKKFEAARPELEKDGERLIDLVITTSELCDMIEEAGIDFAHLPDEARRTARRLHRRRRHLRRDRRRDRGRHPPRARRCQPQHPADHRGVRRARARGHQGLHRHGRRPDHPHRGGQRSGECRQAHRQGRVRRGAVRLHRGHGLPERLHRRRRPAPACNKRKAERAEAIFKADEACALRIPQQNPDLGYVYDTLLQGRAHELLHIHYPAHGQHS